MSTREDQGFTAFDEPPIRHGDTNHGDECECADCREVRAGQYAKYCERAEWARKQFAELRRAKRSAA